MKKFTLALISLASMSLCGAEAPQKAITAPGVAVYALGAAAIAYSLYQWGTGNSIGPVTKTGMRQLPAQIAPMEEGAFRIALYITGPVGHHHEVQLALRHPREGVEEILDAQLLMTRIPTAITTTPQAELNYRNIFEPIRGAKNHFHTRLQVTSPWGDPLSDCIIPFKHTHEQDRLVISIDTSWHAKAIEESAPEPDAQQQREQL